MKAMFTQMVTEIVLEGLEHILLMSACLMVEGGY